MRVSPPPPGRPCWPCSSWRSPAPSLPMPRSGLRASGRRGTGAPAGMSMPAPMGGTDDLERPGGGPPVHGSAGPDGCPAGDDPGPGGGRRHGRGARPRPGPAGHRAERLRGAAGDLVPGLPGAGCHLVRADGRRRGSPAAAGADPGEGPEAGGMTPAVRRWVFLAGMAGLAAFYLWGLTGLPGFGNYPGPYGDIINRIDVAQTKATGVVSAVNFEYRGFDTLGEEFILFTAAVGTATVLRHLRGERERAARDEAMDRNVPPVSGAVRMVSLLLVGPTLLVGWYLASHAQTSPSGGFQGGVVLATSFILIYLAGEFLVFRRIGPVDVTDAVGAVGAGGFAALGVSAVAMGLPYLSNFLPLGSTPGAVSSSGTIALISFFVGIEVAAAFVLIVSELLDQTLFVRRESR